MKFLPRSGTAAAALALATALGPGAAGAQGDSYPSRPISLVVPYPAGGSADILARNIGQKLAERLGQPVLIENKAGAGTAIGARHVAEARADGYTLLLGTVSSQAINPAMSKVGYDPLKDLTAIGPLASIPFVLVATANAPYASVADMVAVARQNPGQLSYASAGPGTSNHLAGEMLASAAGIKLLHAPYRGSAPALSDVLAGHVPLMFDLQSTAVPNIRTGKLKALAVTSSQRSPLLPQVPTVAESGFAGFEVSAWFGVFAPTKVPESVQARLSQDIAQILRMPEVAARLREIGAEPDLRTRQEFSSYVAAEAGKYSAVVRAAGLAP
ncbi:Bug family tripartite tricarboxylate transporter substrate binding protein [Variovorax sp. M-6]|uniref:Bug family tripartite tricarboxylate transporter substrate binding protein n=1 Tax=Variovorax sp. M-6 TaxID=3233041 RepID=UPI003F9EA3DC